MNWTQIEGQWHQFKGKVRTQWGKLTDDDVERCEGRRDRLIGKLEERYGETKEW
ncbi:CsbD-like protein, partial [Plesiocystis pacifica SIR-1]